MILPCYNIFSNIIIHYKSSEGKALFCHIDKIKSPETVEFQGFSFGGDKRDRTADLLICHALFSFQISYIS